MQQVIKMKIFLTILCCLFLFSGCAKPQESLKQVDSNILDQYSMVEKKEDSIYLISGANNSYVVFYKKNVDPESVNMGIKDKEYSISFNTGDKIDTLVYELNFKRSEDSKLILIEDGHEVSFETVILSSKNT